jgi:hypothetical protein|tara:strand:+ start:69 stop:329 length:261 start_codon:yes stop_codon:yes gene_type:complete
MEKKYQAKRLHKGEYLYRGYIIVDMTATSGYTHWNIGKAIEDTGWVDMDGFFESTNTLSDAKLEVDHYVEFAQHEVTHSLNQLMRL